MTATVLATTKLLGKERVPGDELTEAEVNQLSDKVRQGLLNSNVITFEPATLPEPTEQEKEAIAALKKARDTAAKADDLVSDLERQLKDKQTEINSKADEDKKILLDAAKGDKKAQRQAEENRADRVTMKLELEDLHHALEAAKDDVAHKRFEVQQAEAARKLAEGQRLMDEDIEIAGEIEELVNQLAPLVKRYHTVRQNFCSALDVGTKHAPITSNWRIEALLNGRLDLNFVQPGHRFDSFKDMEQHVLTNALRTAERRLVPMEVKTHDNAERTG